MAPPADEPADEPADDQGALSARATALRAVLRDRHALWDPDEPDDELFDALVDLADEVLDVERAAADARERAAHRVSSRRVYAAAGVLACAGAAALGLGLAQGWLSWWGVALTSVAGAAGLILAAAHGFAARDDHEARALFGGVAALTGVAVVALAPGWSPWWVTAIVVVLFVAATAVALTTARLDGAEAPRG